MDAVASMERVREIVGTVLRQRVPKVRVISINVREVEDEYGDDILEVNVIIEAKKSDFDPAKVPSLMREVAEKLDEAEDYRFPIMSFIAKSDLGKTKPDAA